MKKQIIVVRIDMSDSNVPLDSQISNLCEVNFASGYTLISTFVHAENLVLIFKLL